MQDSTQEDGFASRVKVRVTQTHEVAVWLVFCTVMNYTVDCNSIAHLALTALLCTDLFLTALKLHQCARLHCSPFTSIADRLYSGLRSSQLAIYLQSKIGPTKWFKVYQLSRIYNCTVYVSIITIVQLILLAFSQLFYITTDKHTSWKESLNTMFV